MSLQEVRLLCVLSKIMMGQIYMCEIGGKSLQFPNPHDFLVERGDWVRTARHAIQDPK